ncbi:sensor histidine kinase [Croceicoccus naphthovorans]|uniref:sensor histidine kinase n=1 Tax=Croceicoccus naphthovorans TaxID=1348774 RepID=UPI00069D8A71|nr:histidine kinase dimerization/phospho-acceptor domain-containing protein [Croceicoccus naphthovorans]MBB3990511.1 signal transduction histidine kinase [Croceicoccus naphthovorans]
MTLDDRLRTVLEVAADSDGSARAQYRQLVDLLGSGKTVADGSLIAAAFLRLGALARRIPAGERAAILADPALRLRSPPLVAQLCEGEQPVADAAIDAADLDEDGWTVLTSVLDDRLQARVRNARLKGRARQGENKPPLLMQRTAHRSSILDDLTPSAPMPSRLPKAEPAQPKTPELHDISDIVARIERFRLKRREQAVDEALGKPREEEPLELTDAIEPEAAAPPIAAREVDCMISPEGRINWADRLAPMLSGLILSASGDAAARLDEATATALRRQQAVRGGKVTIAASPVISGEWRLDAAPNFDPVGRFLGHHARLTRRLDTETDARGTLVRQALHELRTPINALQGFSEIIQQQLFGPVPHQYRALAAGIAGETAALLAGLDEVDRLVRLRLGNRKLAEGETALGPLVASLAEQVRPMLGSRGALLVGQWADPDVVVSVARAELERSFWRVLAVAAAAAGDGDRVAMGLTAQDDRATLSISLPAALAAMDDEALYGASAKDERSLAVGLLGRGFALRLAAAEARAAGGSLERQDDALIFTLPCHNAEAESHSEVAA